MKNREEYKKYEQEEWRNNIINKKNNGKISKQK